MRLLFSDGRLLKRGGRLSLVQFDGQWYVVGDGYVCRVDDCDEGLDLIARLGTHGMNQDVFIALRGRSTIHC